mgnify:CR=1 FL=1
MHRIGIVGLGHLGEIHLKQWLEIVPKENIACFDSDNEKLDSISKAYQIERVASYEELLERSDIIDIVTPTNFHFALAELGLLQKKHLFIEKPVCQSVSQVDKLIELQKLSNTLVQVGHVERYNPAFMSVESSISNPRFFEVHRLAPFVSRGTEVSVIMDLMIHDLDIILHLVSSDIKNIYANGVGIVSKTPDIANVRLEFENGCIANLTSSRISMKRMRKMRIFSNQGYVSIDFLEKNSEIINIIDANENSEGLLFTTHEGIEKKLEQKEYRKMDKNAIHAELNDFFSRIIEKKNDTAVNLLSARKTLALAEKIQDLIA